MIKRLPMWGLKVKKNQIDFEWPTQEIVNAFQSKFKLRTFCFKTRNSYVSSVQCILSNGQVSPLFESQNRELVGGFPHQYPININFDDNTPIRSVAASVESFAVRRIQFLDANRVVQCSYNPLQNQDRVSERILEENEELIGVYGQKYFLSYFAGFGFLVLVKQ